MKLPKKIALDSNIFIYALESDESIGGLARQLIEQIKKTQQQVIISVLLIEELFVKVYKESRQSQKKEILEFLSIGGLVKIINIDEAIALKAAQIRANFPKIKTPDAIHLASAIESGVKMFITTDRALPGKIDNLSIANLKELKLN